MFFEGFIRNARTERYHIMCSIDAHEKSIDDIDVMMSAAVGVLHYQQIRKHKHWFLSVPPWILSVVG